MGGYKDLERKLLAQKMRASGYSYREIREKIVVSKGTLSVWCRDIALTEEQALRLSKKKLLGAERGRIIGAKRQQARRIKQIEDLCQIGKNQVGKLTKRDRFVIGVALYCAEGTKGDKSIGFANTDPKVISFMAGWFREFCDMDDKKLKGAIWIHDNLDENKAKEFWSKISGIPVERFHKTYKVKPKNNSNKIRKNIHSYGVFSIRVGNAKVKRLLNGWMAGIFDSFVV